MPVMPTADGLSLKRPIQCVLKGNFVSMGSALSASLPAGGPVRSVGSEQPPTGRTPSTPPSRPAPASTPPPVPAPPVPATPLVPAAPLPPEDPPPPAPADAPAP